MARDLGAIVLNNELLPSFTRDRACGGATAFKKVGFKESGAVLLAVVEGNGSKLIVSEWPPKVLSCRGDMPVDAVVPIEAILSCSWQDVRGKLCPDSQFASWLRHEVMFSASPLVSLEHGGDGHELADSDSPLRHDTS